MLLDQNKFRIRPAKMGLDVREDRRFIESTWLASYRQSCRWLPYREYLRLYRKVVEQELENMSVGCWVICSSDCDEQLFGWICGYTTKPMLHYVYVKQAVRGLGFGLALINHYSSTIEIEPDCIEFSAITIDSHRLRLDDARMFKPDYLSRGGQ